VTYISTSSRSSSPLGYTLPNLREEVDMGWIAAVVVVVAAAVGWRKRDVIRDRVRRQ
jgi:hypothetical protein